MLGLGAFIAQTRTSGAGIAHRKRDKLVRIRIVPGSLCEYSDMDAGVCWNDVAGMWEAHVTYAERRHLLQTTPIERRFVTDDGVVCLGDPRGALVS